MPVNTLLGLVSLLAIESTPPSSTGAHRDSLRFAATRTADSLAVAECVQRVAERNGFTPLTEVEAADAKVMGRRWGKIEGDGVTATELRTWIQVKADSITVPARVERKNVNATIATVGVGVLQVSSECRRARTPAPGSNGGK